MFTPFVDLTEPALLSWLLKATALLLIALAATSVLRRRSAGARHLVWLASLVGVLALPALSLWTPVRLAILPSRLTPPLAPPVATERPVPRVEDVSPSETRSASTKQPVSPAAPASVAALVGTTESKPLFPIGATIVVVWGAMTVALLGWLAYGALSVRRIVGQSRSLANTPWMTSLCDIADRLDLDTVPRLVASDRVEMPFACGLLRPTIVLPATSEAWSADRRRAVLFHELAHVKRRDLVGHTLGRLACAIYWFHPLVWTAARRLRAESERACDDLVLSCGARASDYADHLLDLVVGVRRHGAPATAMPMARRRELEGRVLAILDPGVRRVAPGRLQSAGLVAFHALIALSVAAMAPASRSAPPDSGSNGPNENVVRLEAPSSAQLPARTDAGARNTPSIVNGANPQAAQGAASSAEVQPLADVKQPTLLGAVGQIVANAAAPLSQELVRQAASALLATQGEQAAKKRSPEEVRADSERVKLLARVLRTDPEASVRRTAAWGLSEARDISEATEALLAALRSDSDHEVREMAAWALAGLKREGVQRALAEAMRRDASEEVRETAAWALVEGGARAYQEAFEAALSDASASVRETAAWAFGIMGRRPAPRALIAALADAEPEVRETAAWALAEIEDAESGPAIVDAFLKETNGEVRLAELRALSFIGVQDRRVLDAALASKDVEVRARAVRSLAGAGAGPWPEPRPRPRPRPSP